MKILNFLYRLLIQENTENVAAYIHLLLMYNFIIKSNIN